MQAIIKHYHNHKGNRNCYHKNSPICSNPHLQQQSPNFYQITILRSVLKSHSLQLPSKICDVGSVKQDEDALRFRTLASSTSLLLSFSSSETRACHCGHQKYMHVYVSEHGHLEQLFLATPRKHDEGGRRICLLSEADEAD
jgi:hypothetical protein